MAHVSNPIREYLQIWYRWSFLITSTSFKPYKGVSSNKLRFVEFVQQYSFKPYKGVSSNLHFPYFSDEELEFQTL